MTSYEVLTLLIALLAVVVAFYALYRAHRIGLEQLVLQKTQAELAKFQHDILIKEEAAKQRADIRLTVVKEDRTTRRLVITNVGLGVARDVVFNVVGEDSFLIQSEMDELLPITELSPDQELSMIITPTIHSASHSRVQINWIAQGGEHESKNLEITLN